MAHFPSVLLTIIICTWYNQCDPLGTFNWLQVLFQTLFLPPSLSFFFLEKIKWIEFPWWPAGKEICLQCGRPRFDPPGEGNSYPLQYSGLKNCMQCIVHGVTKSDFHFYFFKWIEVKAWSGWADTISLLKKKNMGRWLYWRIRCLKGVFYCTPTQSLNSSILESPPVISIVTVNLLHRFLGLPLFHLLSILLSLLFSIFTFTP